MCSSDLDHQMLALWAAACAERVLSLFEDASPNDNRPRTAIDAARSWAHGDLKMTGRLSSAQSSASGAQGRANGAQSRGQPRRS